MSLIKTRFRTIVKILSFLCVFFIGYQSSDAKIINGYYIDLHQDTTYATFKVPYRFIPVIPKYVKLLKGVEVTSSDTTFKLKPQDCSQIILMIEENQSVTLISKQNIYFPRINADYIFLRRSIEGPISIFHFSYYEHTTAMNANGTGSMSAVPTTDLLLEKTNGEYIILKNGKEYKERLGEFFKDSINILEEVNKSYLYKQDIIQIVKKYNEQNKTKIP